VHNFDWGPLGAEQPYGPTSSAAPPAEPSWLVAPAEPGWSNESMGAAPQTASVAQLAPVTPATSVAPAESVPGGRRSSSAPADGRATLHSLLTSLVEMDGSDLHLTVEAPPSVRIYGDLRPLPGYDPLTAGDVAALMRAALEEPRWERFGKERELNFSYDMDGALRFRANYFVQRASYAAVFRAIPSRIKELDELGMPASVARFAGLHRGLVLVTGPTGSGKSTTLAAVVDLANRTRAAHIVTIEDPIEFLHYHKKCLVNQREVGEDTESFPMALKNALRQDPDIILVGELRDLETAQTAIAAAETGHLVLATLHTQSAAQTVDRLIDMFPPAQQPQIRAQLSNALQGVVSQTLCPRADGQGRVVATEVMIATSAIRNLIREGKIHQIPSFMQSGGEGGMLTFDQHLAMLVREQSISVDYAVSVCHSPDILRSLLRQ
jgi:twitching motility protein PilT